MPRASLLFASVLSLCLAVPSFAQENQRDNPEQTNQQQNQNRQKNNRQDSQNPQMAEVSLEEGQTIAIPAGGELLELTVAVPKTVHSGQQYRYRARVRNTSDKITLANVKLVQINGQQVDIEEAQLINQTNQQQKNKKNQQAQKQNPQGQQGSQSEEQAQQSTQGTNRSWSLGQLKPGQSQELAVTAIANQTGQLEHCFSVKYDEVLCTQVDVVNPKVTITKAGPDQAVVCEIFEYKYTVKNTGTGVAENFIVRDQLPQGLMTKSGKDTLEFRVPDLKEGQTETYVAEVHAMEPGQFSSRATVEEQGGDTSRSGNVTTQVIAPELNVQIEGPRAFKAGEGANFDVVVQNTGDVPARNVVLSIDPGKNARVTRAGEGDARDGGNTYRYTLGDLEAGAEESISISLDGAAQSSKKQEMVQLQATAKALCAREQQQDKVVAQAEGQMQSRVLRLTSLLLTLVDTDDVIPQGKNVTYRIRVQNQGSHPDEDVKVSLRLPSGLKFKEASGPSDATANGQRVVLGTVEEVGAGETLEWQVTTTSESAGEQVVAATLDSKALNNTIEAEEVTTIYDASKQQSSSASQQQSGKTKTASKKGETQKE